MTFLSKCKDCIYEIFSVALEAFEIFWSYFFSSSTKSKKQKSEEFEASVISEQNQEPFLYSSSLEKNKLHHSISDEQFEILTKDMAEN